MKKQNQAMNFKNLFHSSLYTLIFLFVTGCVTLKDMNIEDLKTQENLKRELVLNMTLPDIKRSLFIYNSKCSKINEINSNPENSNQANISFEVNGFSRANVGMYMEFNQIGEKTKVLGYSYYENWAVLHIDKTIRIIKNPLQCQ